MLVIHILKTASSPVQILDGVCYTRWWRESMKTRSKSYPDKIRRIAEDLSKMRNLYEVDCTVEKLRMIASELEHNLKKALTKKA